MRHFLGGVSKYTPAAGGGGTAIIGDNSIPASGPATTQANWKNECLVGAAARYTGITGDTVTKLWVYGDGTGDCEVGVYTYSGGVPVTKVGSATVSVGATAGWYSTTVSYPLTNGVVYVVGIDYHTGTDWGWYYELLGGTETSISDNTSALASTWAQSSTSGYTGGLYAEVTHA